MQEIYLRALKKLDSLRDPDRKKEWLFRIARNTCLNHSRKERLFRLILTREVDHTIDHNSPEWQMIQTERWKYIRWLDYPDADAPKESFFDLQTDPDEIDDRIADPTLREAIEWCRRRRDFVLDRTPPAQLGWAPLID